MKKTEFLNRTATAKDRSDQAAVSAYQATEDSSLARLYAKQLAPDFHQPGIDRKIDW